MAHPPSTPVGGRHRVPRLVGRSSRNPGTAAPVQPVTVAAMSISERLVRNMLKVSRGEQRHAALRLRHPRLDEHLAAVSEVPARIRDLPAAVACDVATLLDDETRALAAAAEPRATVREALGATGAETTAAYPDDVAGWMAVLAGVPSAAALIGAYRWASDRHPSERHAVVAAVARTATRRRWDTPGLGDLAGDLLDGIEPAVSVADLETTAAYVEGRLVRAYLGHTGIVDARAAGWLLRFEPGTAVGLLDESGRAEQLDPAALDLWDGALDASERDRRRSARALLCATGAVPVRVDAARVLADTDMYEAAELLRRCDPGSFEELVGRLDVQPDAALRAEFDLVDPPPGASAGSVARLLSWCGPSRILNRLLLCPDSAGDAYGALAELARRLLGEDSSATVRLPLNELSDRLTDDDAVDGVRQALELLWRTVPAALLVERAEGSKVWCEALAALVAQVCVDVGSAAAVTAFGLLDSWDGTFAEVFATAATLTAPGADQPAAA